MILTVAKNVVVGAVVGTATGILYHDSMKVAVWDVMSRAYSFDRDDHRVKVAVQTAHQSGTFHSSMYSGMLVGLCIALLS